MKSLRFEKLELLSLVESKALTVEFHPELTVIKGVNDVGKSSVIKSIYWAFGAAPKSIHPKWAGAKVKARLSFTVDGVAYSVLRSRDTVAVFDADQQLLISTSSVTSELAPFLAGLINFGLVLSNRKGQPEVPPPAFAFLPFYVNQEGGWERPFNSFDKLQQYTNYKRSVIDYHSGILGNEYYALDAEKRRLGLERDELYRERTTIAKAVERLGLEAGFSGLEFSLEGHEQSVERLLLRLTRLREARQNRAANFAMLLDRRSALESQVRIAKQAIAELEKDAAYAASLEADEVLCPTCGTVHQNDFANRFGILDDREACFEFLTESNLTLRALAEEARQAEEEVRGLDATMEEINALLHQRRGDLTLREVIEAEGRKSAAGMLRHQIEELDRRAGEHQGVISDIDQKMKELRSPQRRENIERFYAELMLSYLGRLDVASIDHAAVSDINGRITETGSDQPRAVLAYDLAFLKTVHEFSTAFTAPMVLDSPNQQDQDPVNVKAMIELVVAARPEGSQMILGTVSTYGVDLGDAQTIEFAEKLSVLRADEFETVYAAMRPLFDQMQL